MDDLVRWLGEQLDEDERIARAATPGPWTVDSGSHTEAIRASSGTDVVAGGRWGGEAPVFESDEDAAHIAMWDPARVLREVDAKRQIIEQHERYTAERRRMMGGWDPQSDDSPILAAVAAVYADRPGYREEWRP